MVRTLSLILWLVFASSAFADGPDSWALKQAAGNVADLEFPAAPASLDDGARPRMALFKPAGSGPFPALVLHHQCGGLGNARWQNTSMMQWAKEAVSRGYVALLIDSLGPRGVDSVCYGPQRNVTFPVGVKDALRAADYLSRLDFVDGARIGHAGYSWGAMVATLLSSRAWGEALAQGTRFAAAVAFYPGCFTIRPKTGPEFEIVRRDIDRPLLVLLGGEDTETPPEECAARLHPAKAAGAPVEWHLFPAATHCWDCAQLNGFSKTDFRGNRVTYRYDGAITADSAKRMFDFFERAMPKR